MSADYLQVNQPDILEVIANLSNDAVFTPPKVVNAVLDLLPAEVWSDPSLRWLDPGAKTGVFPREITKRLMVGLAGVIPEESARLQHILTEMIFAIATEEITGMMTRRSLYCSKDASTEFSVARFTEPDGNVWQRRVKHSFDAGGRCKECKGNQEQLLQPGRDNKAYGFIHADGRGQIEKEMDMRFDVIVGNPPYQMDADGGNRTMPIYNIFVDEAKRLNPRFISMIIPSRWMAGGLGLNEFRNEMLADKRLRRVSDFSKMETLFPGVDFEGGVCYFLWDRDNPGPCEVTFTQDAVTVGPFERQLDEFDVFVRDARGLEILNKVMAKKEASLIDILAADKEFGMTSNWSDFRTAKRAGDIAFYYNEKGKRLCGWIARKTVPKSAHLIDFWKVLVPKAYGERGAIPALVLGPTQIVAPPSVCTQTYLFIYVNSKEAAESVESYVKTRFFRFLVSLRKISQDATRSTYNWVPQQVWDRTWTDAELFKKYDITPEEQSYIEEMVRERSA
jgi:site-specific DNA-methyltransferase (adenine-specific)